MIADVKSKLLIPVSALVSAFFVGCNSTPTRSSASYSVQHVQMRSISATDLNAINLSAAEAAAAAAQMNSLLASPPSAD